jgi:hypothetical protein
MGWMLAPFFWNDNGQLIRDDLRYPSEMVTAGLNSETINHGNAAHLNRDVVKHQRLQCPFGAVLQVIIPFQRNVDNSYPDFFWRVPSTLLL